RNSVLRRSYPCLMFVAAIAPTAAPAAPAPAPAVPIAVVGPAGVIGFSVLVAEIGVHVASGRRALVLGRDHVRWRLIVWVCGRFGSRAFAFECFFQARAVFARLAAPAASPPSSSSPTAPFAILGTLLGGFARFIRLGCLGELVVLVLLGVSL